MILRKNIDSTGQRIVEFMSINDNPMTIIESATIMKNYG